MKMLTQEVIGYVRSFSGRKDISGIVFKNTWENGLTTYQTTYRDGHIMTSSVRPDVDITQAEVLERLNTK